MGADPDPVQRRTGISPLPGVLRLVPVEEQELDDGQEQDGSGAKEEDTVARRGQGRKSQIGRASCRERV